jgi:heme-degrading monooxygenase HmoA
MYARVTIVQILPGKVDKAVGIYRDSVTPAVLKQKGSKGTLLMTDRKTGKGISITLWKTKTEMRAGESSGFYQKQVAKFKDIFGAPPVREQYEVTVQA